MPRCACFLLLATVAACATGIHFISPDISPGTGLDLIETNGVPGILLERYLWQQGLYPVTGIWSGGHCIDWADAASQSLWYIPVILLSDGGLSVFGERVDGGLIAVVTEPRPDRSILDVAPTACGALGLRGRYDGRDICRVNATQVVVVYVDGLGWHRYCRARPLMSNFSALEPAPASCVYPSISNVNSAAMLTGACPERSGIDRWDKRQTLTDDAITVALQNGISAAWINGPRPPVSLRQGIVAVSDTNGDGSTDDEVAEQALAHHENGTRLLYVHLVDTDRALHASGPYSKQSLDSAVRADVLIGRIASRMRPGTMLIVVADHGGHDVAGFRGDHGSLLPQDMLIPMSTCIC